MNDVDVSKMLQRFWTICRQYANERYERGQAGRLSEELTTFAETHGQYDNIALFFWATCGQLRVYAIVEILYWMADHHRDIIEAPLIFEILLLDQSNLIRIRDAALLAIAHLDWPSSLLAVEVAYANEPEGDFRRAIGQVVEQLRATRVEADAELADDLG